MWFRASMADGSLRDRGKPTDIVQSPRTMTIENQKGHVDIIGHDVGVGRRAMSQVFSWNTGRIFACRTTGPGSGRQSSVDQECKRMNGSPACVVRCPLGQSSCGVPPYRDRNRGRECGMRNAECTVPVADDVDPWKDRGLAVYGNVGVGGSMYDRTPYTRPPGSADDDSLPG